MSVQKSVETKAAMNELQDRIKADDKIEVTPNVIYKIQFPYLIGECHRRDEEKKREKSSTEETSLWEDECECLD